MTKKRLLFLLGSTALAANTFADIANPETGSPAWQNRNFGFIAPSLIPSRSAPETRGSKPSVVNKSLVFDQGFDVSKKNPVAAKSFISEIPQTPLPAKPIIQEKWTPIFDDEKLSIDLSPKEKIEIQLPKQAAALLSPTPKIIPVISKNSFSDSISLRALKSWPTPTANRGRVLVIDEDSLGTPQPMAVAHAKIFWIHPNSGIQNQTDEAGLAESPFPKSHSVRFLVQAPGYVPAMGYAVREVLTPVALYKEAKVPAILKSLGLVPQAGEIQVFGKALNNRLQPVKGLTVESSDDRVKQHYSVGSWGLFHPGARSTGERGDFVLSNLQAGLHSIMPTLISELDPKHAQSEEREWPPYLADFSEMPSLFSMTLLEGIKTGIETQIVDSNSLEASPAALHASILGLSGLHVPDEQGFLKLENLYKRPAVDIVEINAQGYQKTWVSSVASKVNFPDSVLLFSLGQLGKVFSPLESEMTFDHPGVLFGILRPDEFKKSQKLALYGANGRRVSSAKTYYFDDEGINQALKSSEENLQSFVISDVPEGEHHLISIDASSGRSNAIQVIRVQKNTITEIQF